MSPLEIEGAALDKLTTAAEKRGVSVEQLLTELTAEVEIPVTPDHENSMRLDFACPHEDCAYRSFTLAATCPEHGVHVC
jgi:hypothetical protein